jgi:hypothetical protein
VAQTTVAQLPLGVPERAVVAQVHDLTGPQEQLILVVVVVVQVSIPASIQAETGVRVLSLSNTQTHLPRQSAEDLQAQPQHPEGSR